VLFSPKLKRIYILKYRSTPTKSCAQVQAAVAIRAIPFSLASHASFNIRILESTGMMTMIPTTNGTSCRYSTQILPSRDTREAGQVLAGKVACTYLMPEMCDVNILCVHRVLSNATYIRAVPFHLSKHRCFTRCSRARYSTTRDARNS